MIKFTEEHEWLLVDGDTVTVGITDYAQKALGDVVFVELPEVGASFGKDEDAAVVESVKAASDVFAPISGEIMDVNGALEDDPSLVNSAAMDAGWFFKMKASDMSEMDAMMDETGYNDFVAGLE